MFLSKPPDIQQLKAKNNVNGLIKALDYTQDWRISQAAAEALGLLRDPRAVKPLIATLNSKPAPVVREALLALGRIGDLQAVPSFITGLKDKNLKEAAYKGFAKLGVPAIPALTNLLTEDDKRLRWGAVMALALIGGPCTLRFLVVALSDQAYEVREAAAIGLDGLNWKPETEKDRIAYWIARQDWDKCLQLKPLAIQSLVLLLKDDFDCLRRDVATALRSSKEPVVVIALIEALQDESCIVREAAADSLGRINDPHAVEPLIALLQDEDYNVRRTVAQALGEIGDPRAVNHLLNSLGDDSYLVQEAAIAALGKIGSPVLEPLFTKLTDRDAAVRKAAAMTLDILKWEPGADETGAAYWAAKQRWGKCKQLGTLAVNPLIALLNDSDDKTRESAASTLSKIEDPRAIEPLIKILNGEDPDLSYAAMQALIQMTSPMVIDYLVHDLQSLSPLRSWKASETLTQMLSTRHLDVTLKQRILEQHHRILQIRAEHERIMSDKRKNSLM